VSRPDVIVVDDHLLLAEVLSTTLASRDIPAESLFADSAEELLARLLERRPGVVLLDLDLGPLGSSRRLIGPLVRAGIRVVLMTGASDRLSIAEALELGAAGYQPKADGFEALLRRAVSALRPEQSGSVADAEFRAALLAELAASRTVARKGPHRFEALTEREAQVLRSLCAGSSVRDIAASWVVSETTVRSHVRGVLTKLSVASQLAAVVAARTSGWLSRMESDGPLARSVDPAVRSA
jgi:two-component system nitrate/nitrite response regulator NarL